jgi:hypothetical protein
MWHPKNYLTGGNNYDRPRDDWEPVLQCLSPSGSQLAAYRADLDMFSNSLALCLDDNGQRIPFWVRIGNETNGWFDYPNMSVDSLTRSGTTATMHFTRGIHPITGQWSSAGAKFQIRGASDSRWNTLFDIGGFVLDGDGNGGTVSFTVNTSPPSSPTGTITTNALAGDWWAGADRAADALLLWRQTIDYLRDVRGCNQLIWGCNIYPDNRLAPSTNPTVPGQEYSIWLTDAMKPYWDVVTANLYQDEPISWGFCDFAANQIVSSFQILADWCAANGRPLIMGEFGARFNGRDDPLFWSAKCMGAFDARYPALTGVCTWTPTIFLPALGTPAAADFAVAMSNPRYRWLGQ